MAEVEHDGNKSSLISRCWRFLWRPSTAIPVAGLLIIGVFGGVLFWGGLHWAMELSNSEAFCVSCHEMEKPFESLKKTVHYTNRTGVRATCSDCHVPKEWVHKIQRKVIATKDLYFHLTGKIDTPEKYETHRLEMAITVWHQLKGTNSRECRNCHEAVWMDTSKQWGGAQRNHQVALENGLTCIDCHQGVAHDLPKEFARPTAEQLVEDSTAWLAAMEAASARPPGN